MKKTAAILLLVVIICCTNNSNKNRAFVPSSSGNLNNVTVIMPQKEWQGNLGDQVREALEEIYEGLPLDEPQFSIVYMNPKAFTGFARQNRNIIWFRKDSLEGFRMSQNQFARPQIVAKVIGLDSESQAFYFKENILLIKQSISENERLEKLRRIKKAPTKE